MAEGGSTEADADVARPGIMGRRIVVVGASAGIGRAFAVAAATTGADVVLASRRLDALRKVAGQVGWSTWRTESTSRP